MERLVNKKVRLRSRISKRTLVACSDKESVSHASLHEHKPKPENSVWVIKSKHPDKSVRLESVYGKLLGVRASKGAIAVQEDRPSPNKEHTSNKAHSRWILEDVDNSGFTCVQIRLSYFSDKGVYLFPSPDSPEVTLSRADFYWWSSWLLDRIFYWDLEIVETPTPALTTTISEDRGSSKPGDKLNPIQVQPASIIDGMPAPACTLQVNKMYVQNVYNKSAEGTSPFPFINYDVNSGRNINESGTQIVGGVTVQTRIDHFVNKNIVKRGG